MAGFTFFQRIALALIVGDIANELAPPLGPENTFEDVQEILREANEQEKEDWFCIVKEGNHFLGYTCPDSEKSIGAEWDSPIRNYLESIKPEQIVAFDLPVLNVIPILHDQFYLFVQQGNQITHVLTFTCLDKIPFRQCILSLMLEAEYYMERIISHNKQSAVKRFRLLSLERQYKASQLYSGASELSRITDTLLNYTTFADKVSIFHKDKELRGVLPFASNRSSRRFFKEMENIRNAVAHGRTLIPEIQALSHFVVFIQEVHELIKHLSGYYVSISGDHGDEK